MDAALWMLRCGIYGGAFVCGPVQLAFHLHFLLPFCVGDLLVGCEDGVNLAVGVLVDGAASLVVRLFITGGIRMETIQCYVQAQKDRPKPDHLILIEIELPLQHHKLASGPLGWGGRRFPGRGGVSRIDGSVSSLRPTGAGEADQKG